MTEIEIYLPCGKMDKNGPYISIIKKRRRGERSQPPERVKLSHDGMMAVITRGNTAAILLIIKRSIRRESERVSVIYLNREEEIR